MVVERSGVTKVVADLLTTLDLPALKQSLQDDSANYIRLLNVLPRLTQGGLACERQRLEIAERQAALEKERNPEPGGVSPETLRRIETDINFL